MIEISYRAYGKNMLKLAELNHRGWIEWICGVYCDS